MQIVTYSPFKYDKFCCSCQANLLDFLYMFVLFILLFSKLLNLHLFPQSNNVLKRNQ